jgi:hypothetical protein
MRSLSVPTYVLVDPIGSGDHQYEALLSPMVASARPKMNQVSR